MFFTPFGFLLSVTNPFRGLRILSIELLIQDQVEIQELLPCLCAFIIILRNISSSAIIAQHLYTMIKSAVIFQL